eukprot:m.1638165 g.1638165  ORF g.1638165 m.1638165 type:complete len:203 (+) comp27106_c0_seq1:97-705(+)
MANQRTIEGKVVLIGGQGVGKTSIIVRFLENKFTASEVSTIGAAFFTHEMTIDRTLLRLQIWDTAGQERFRSMGPMYYRGSSAALAVYDITSQKSFREVCDVYIPEFSKHVTGPVAMCICGNKCDMEADRAVQMQEAEMYAKAHNALFIETSAKTAFGVKDAFLAMGRQIIANKGTRDTTRDSRAILGDGDSIPGTSACSCG